MGDEIFFSQYLKEGDCCVDVGANMGALAIHAGTLVGPVGRVIAIEAHPRIAGFLRRNIALNGLSNIETVSVAVGEHAGHVKFTNIRSDDQNAVVDDNHGTIPMKRLDDIVPFDVQVDLLKIDVEGYELKVLQGSERVLATTQVVYFEAWEQHYRKLDYSTPDVTAYLSARGFEVLLRDHEGILASVPPDWHADECVNLVALRR